jgi:hypothetical protein
MDAKRATALSATALVVAVLGYTPVDEGAHLTSATTQGPKRDAGLANVAIRVSPAFVDPGARSEEASVFVSDGRAPGRRRRSVHAVQHRGRVSCRASPLGRVGSVTR